MTFDFDVFASRLRGKRAEAGLNQMELSELIGVNYTTVSKWEQGAQMPGADKVFAIADALGTTPDYLLGWPERA